MTAGGYLCEMPFQLANNLPSCVDAHNPSDPTHPVSSTHLIPVLLKETSNGPTCILRLVRLIRLIPLLLGQHDFGGLALGAPGEGKQVETAFEVPHG